MQPQKLPEVTMNDVVLMVCSSALRRYLAEHDALPQESLVTWMPISTRSDEDHSAEQPDHDGVCLTGDRYC